MPRKTLIRSKVNPYHVTGRVNNREKFPSDLNYAWKVFSQQLTDAERNFHAKIHAFVLMDNHFHLLVSTPENDLGQIMQGLMRSVTKTINRKTDRSGRLFGSKYHWSLIDSLDYFDCVVKYIYRNPVKAGMVDEVENYPFSSLKFALQAHGTSFALYPPIGEKELIPRQNVKEYLDWLNIPFSNEDDKKISAAFKNSEFVIVFPRRKRVDEIKKFLKTNTPNFKQQTILVQ